MKLPILPSPIMPNSILQLLCAGSRRGRRNRPIIRRSKSCLRSKCPVASTYSVAGYIMGTLPRHGSSRPMPSQGCPRTTLLANGEYAVMLTDAGSGYSRWRNLAITRWREDTTCDPWGSWFYLRDVHGDEERHPWPRAPWSPGLQPLGSDGAECESHLLEHAALYAHREGDLTTTLEIALHGSDALEVRGIGLRNDGDKPREIEITSYAELVLGNPGGDASHPAFSKMFVQTHRQDRKSVV